MNKKAMGIIPIFLFIFAVFFFALFLGLSLFGFNQINDALDVDIDIGQVNLRTINNQTFGQINQGFVDNADLIGILVLLTMSVLMIFIGYFFGRDYPVLFFATDIIILIFAFIMSIYISQIYDLFIHSTDLFELFIDDIPKTSKFVLNLPLIVGTIGALIMIFSYAGIRKKEGEVNVAGF